MAYTSRKDIPEKYKWNLGDIFTTPQDWGNRLCRV